MRPYTTILPIHLSGEIIQIGAVKLDENFCPAEEFQSDVKPVYFRNMHYKVKKLTGIDKERLSHSQTFPSVFDRFRAWCGEGPYLSPGAMMTGGSWNRTSSCMIWTGIGSTIG